MNILETAALIIGYLITISGVFTVLVKFWKKFKAVAEGQQCQLRNDIIAIYYRHCEEMSPALREYERKNLDDLYEGYKVLDGNHFIDDIYHTMRDWRVVN